MQPDFIDGFGPIFVGGFALIWAGRRIFGAAQSFLSQWRAARRSAEFARVVMEWEARHVCDEQDAQRPQMLERAHTDWRLLVACGFVEEWARR